MNARKIRARVVWAVIIIAGAFFLAILLSNAVTPPAASSFPPSSCGRACSLVIEPDDGVAPLMALLRGADHSIDLVMYELTDPAVIAALKSAQIRGVAVRVILNRNAQNVAAESELGVEGIAVRWAPAQFTFTHEKSVVIDGAKGFIMSFNLVPKYYPTGRDFGVIDDDQVDAAAMAAAFESDWAGGGDDAPAPAGDDLVWSPGARDALVRLIDGASRTLDVYNEEMADDGILAALETAARRGVDVEVVMTYAPEWHDAFDGLASAGGHVRTYPDIASGLYIHAKMIVADDARAFVGSENFSATSLDRNRELGVMISNPDVVAALMRVFDGDLAGATPFRGGG